MRNKCKAVGKKITNFLHLSWKMLLQQGKAVPSQIQESSCHLRDGCEGTLKKKKRLFFYLKIFFKSLLPIQLEQLANIWHIKSCKDPPVVFSFKKGTSKDIQ